MHSGLDGWKAIAGLVRTATVTAACSKRFVSIGVLPFSAQFVRLSSACHDACHFDALVRKRQSSNHYFKVSTALLYVQSF
jgi:hypothetical protein